MRRVWYVTYDLKRCPTCHRLGSETEKVVRSGVLLGSGTLEGSGEPFFLIFLESGVTDRVSEVFDTEDAAHAAHIIATQVVA
jgi:hypothetical protein